MIKKLLLAVAMAIPMFVSAQTLKVGVIDTNAVLQTLPDTKVAETKLAEISKKYEDEFGKLQTEFSRSYEEFTKMDENVPKAIRDSKTADLTNLQKKIEEFQQNASQDLQQEQNRLMQPIIAKVRSAIESVGKEGGFSIIQENTALIYYQAPVMDITPIVKQKLGIK